MNLFLNDFWVNIYATFAPGGVLSQRILSYPCVFLGFNISRKRGF